MNWKHSIVFCLSVFFLMGCNYNYHQGKKLENQDRFEEANIEYHRAYTLSPEDESFKKAYQRTSAETSEDLFQRYKKYLKEKKYQLAFRRLEQALDLSPGNKDIQLEMSKWYRILIAGKVDFSFQSLKNHVPLSDYMYLEIHFNTPTPSKRLKAVIDNQTKTYFVEDVLYDPPQNLLMFYTLNSIGVRLENSKDILLPTIMTQEQIQKGGKGGTDAKALLRKKYGAAKFQKFVDLRTPALVDIRGRLKANGNNLSPVENIYPFDVLKNANGDSYSYPVRGIRYILYMNEKEVRVKSSSGYIQFLPQIMYMNRKNKRIFLDFGHLEVLQKRSGGQWFFRRNVTKGREYLKELQKNIILDPYFYYKEGGYPFVKEGQ